MRLLQYMSTVGHSLTMCLPVSLPLLPCMQAYQSIAEEKGRPPAGPNPYLALTPDATSADYALWSAFLESRSRERAALRESTVTTQEEGPEPGLSGALISSGSPEACRVPSAS